ncbi:M1 family metallopeptidase [Aliidiomarina soli]|uniref:Aminopeptidase N n=1 Tax=Aliidiomarina soli TaxID=1928574 RepID=A0A432WD44_9GAMM|nr:M1 family metallopeptidase [Aliidiomarina soli]RUO30318.1 aminopeptidase [Aliidiomarina soli]
MKTIKTTLLVSAPMWLLACSPAPEPVTDFSPSEHYRVQTPTDDLHSYANTNDVRAPHLHLELDVNFEEKTLSGFAEYQLEYINSEAAEFVLDTDDLDIHRVELSDGEGWQDGSFRLGEDDPVLGAALRIELTDQPTKVRVHYTSSPTATGLDWVEPAGTAGGEHPYLYSQSQPHYARTWVPIQDTASSRLTFSARLTTPPQLIGLMGANNPPNPERTGVYEMASEQAIPPYLMAIAVGDLEFHALNERMAIYAEPSVLEAAVNEFSYTTDMMEVTESMFGPYAWDRYDQLILPPSFPFGGMENPQLAYITPTVIAGDQSLVSLIAHELAHSWSGNLVTNATWRDLWLNEGFTSYVQNRIMEAVYGEERALMERMLADQSLKRSIESLTERQQVLHLELEQRDPETIFTSVPYDKAASFLFFLESRVGRDVFDSFVRQYFADYSFKSLNTKEFEQYLYDNLVDSNDNVSREDVQQWLYQPGLPESMVTVEVDAFSEVDDARQAWLEGAAVDMSQWSIHERLYFLRHLPNGMSDDELARLDRELGLTSTQNNAVLTNWLEIAIRHDYEPALHRVEEMALGMGRLAYLIPVYSALLEADPTRAFELYEQAKPDYHQLTRDSIEALLADAR